MKILITGGAGFIGSNIADAYLRDGHEVIIIDDLSTGKRENVPDPANFYELSILFPEVDRVIAEEKPDILNHQAAQIDVRKSVEDPAEDARANIIGSIKLFESSRKAGVQKIIFASTGGAIYGEQDYFPADENHPLRPLSPYGIAKLAVEKYLYFYSVQYGIPFVALRYANVYGPRQDSHGEAGVVAIFTDKLLREQIPTIYGDGKQTRDYVFIEDVVQCNVRALQPKVQGIFNIGTGIETDVNTLAKELVTLVGNDLFPQYAPARKGEQMRSCIKPSALQTIPPTLLSEGLKMTVEWFKKG